VSQATWTATALWCEARHLDLKVWRLVEAQHRHASAKLVDNREELLLLEKILERHKPPVQRESNDLHPLLCSPFRDHTRVASGSRFRDDHDPGVFYAAETLRTAAAEVGYWRWRFLQDAPGLGRLGRCPFTAFRVPIRGPCIDLRSPCFSIEHLLHPCDYSQTQALAKLARQAAIAAILYPSARDPKHGACAAVLTPQAFAAREPDTPTQSWSLSISHHEALWSSPHAAPFCFGANGWKEYPAQT
jgi:hypothetical protein